MHIYGGHIFHTSNERVWAYMQQFARFNRYVNAPMANYRGKLYNLPFNMNTFHRMWGVITPAEARAKIAEQAAACGVTEPRNLEEQAILLAGRDIYETLVKGYTEKQWGRPAAELPAFIIKRLPLRFTYDNNYYDDLYQGIPEGGYTPVVEQMLARADVRLNTDYFENRAALDATADKVLFTGMIDQYFDYRYGALAYRSLRFETKVLDTDNFQGCAAMNYTDAETPYTRVLEHKHFEFGKQEKTVVTWEYPAAWEPGAEPYYPVNDDANNKLYGQYAALAREERNVLFGGRLAEYRYYDMHQVVERALQLSDAEFPA